MKSKNLAKHKKVKLLQVLNEFMILTTRTQKFNVWLIFYIFSKIYLDVDAIYLCLSNFIFLDIKHLYEVAKYLEMKPHHTLS